MTDILLIDFSSILHQTWHVEASNPNPDATSIKVVERVRALASDKPHAAICLEGKGNFRKELDPTYKANRPAPLAELHHQGAVALDTLKADGFPQWSAPGYEADDVIASAVHALTSLVFYGDAAIIIASADKDLLQLVGPHVKVHSLTSGNTLDEAGVTEKLGVAPNQVVDYLSLLGDSADNIRGASGVGPKGAVKLLNTFGNLDDLYVSIDKGEAALGEKTLATLLEFRGRMPLVRELITLRTDAPIPFNEVLKERQAADVAVFGGDEPFREHYLTPAITQMQAGIAADINETMQPLLLEDPHGIPTKRSEASDRADHGTTAPTPESGTRKPEPSLQPMLRSDLPRAEPASSAPGQPEVVDTLAPAPIEWERQLEPRSLRECETLAKAVIASRLNFGGFGNAYAVMLVVMAGRERGIPFFSSLNAFDNIDAVPRMRANTIFAMVLKSPLCEYFRCTERTPERATFVTKRKGDPEISMTFTIDEARASWKKSDQAWKNSNWGNSGGSADMCVARCSSKLGRLVYPDVVLNLYAQEEFD